MVVIADSQEETIASLEERIASLERVQAALVESLWPGTMADVREHVEKDLFSLAWDNPAFTKKQADLFYELVISLTNCHGFELGDEDLNVSALLGRCLFYVVFGKEDG